MYFYYSHLHVDCVKGNGTLFMSCHDDTLTVSWPTNVTFDAVTSTVPESLETSLNQRIAQQVRGLYLFLPGNTPP